MSEVIRVDVDATQRNWRRTFQAGCRFVAATGNVGGDYNTDRERAGLITKLRNESIDQWVATYGPIDWEGMEEMLFHTTVGISYELREVEPGSGTRS